MRNAKQYWLKHIEAIKAQGMQTTAYARRHNVSLASLYAWQRKLRDEATASKGAAGRSQFVALQVVDAAAAASVNLPVRCTLVLGAGVRLEMQALPDPQWLLAVGAGAASVGRPS
jgi:hypothetical protein